MDPFLHLHTCSPFCYHWAKTKEYWKERTKAEPKLDLGDFCVYPSFSLFL